MMKIRFMTMAVAVMILMLGGVVSLPPPVEGAPPRPIQMVRISPPEGMGQAQPTSTSPSAHDRFRPARLYPEHWTTWAIGALVRALALDDTQVWIGTTDGVIHYNRRDESQKVLTTKDGLLSNIILTIKPDPATPDRTAPGVWFGTYGGGLTHLEGGLWKTYTPFGSGVTTHYGPDWQPYQPGHGVGDLWVYDLEFDQRGTLWVATWKGVSRFNGSTFKTYGTEDGLIDGWVYTMSLDSQGGFWFGTEGGVTFYDGRRWKSWNHQDGVGAVLPEENGSLPPYPTPTPHHQQDSKQVQSYNPNYILTSVVDRKGHIWLGTWGAGLARFDGKRWKNYTTQDGLAGNVVNSLAMDRDGVLWIGTNAGVSRLDEQGFVNYQTAHGLFTDMVYAIAIDEKNHKWFGSYGGLTRYTGP